MTLNATKIHPELYDRPGLSIFNRTFLWLTVFACTWILIETELTLQNSTFKDYFQYIEFAIAIAFLFEFLCRFFTAHELPGVGRGWRRLHYLKSPWVIIDLLAFLPVLLMMTSSGSLTLRFLRLLKFARFLKLGRYSESITRVFDAIKSKRFELLVSFSISLALLLVSATLLYICEAEAQPQQFGSIPRALWWSVITLTTVGYGDVYPITAAGKIVSGAIAYIAIGSIALPTGILASAFSKLGTKNED